MSTYRSKMSRGKVIVSVISGGLGVAASCLSWNAVFPNAEITVIWTCVFPLIISMGWGMPYALVAATVGLVALFPAMIWPDTGWGNPVSAIMLSFFYVWHGFWADCRRRGAIWWNHPLVVQIPFALGGLLMFFLVFRFGKPFLHTDWDYFGLTAGITFSLYVCVLAASFLLKTPWVARALGFALPVEHRFSGKFLLATMGITVGIGGTWQILAHFLVGTGQISMDGSGGNPYAHLAFLLIGVMGLVLGYFVAWLMEKQHVVEDRLTRARDQLQALIDVLPVAVSWADPGGKVQYVNTQFRDLFGYTLEDIPTIEHWHNRVYPDPVYRAHVIAAWEMHINEAKQAGVPVKPYEVDVVCKDGTQRVILLGGVMTSEQILAIFSDITAQKQSETALQRANELTNTLIENVLDAIVACDSAGNLIVFNKTAREWHGLDPDKIPVEEWPSYFGLYNSDATVLLRSDEVPLARSLRGEVVQNVEMAILAKGQPPRFILGNCSPFYDAQHNVIGAVGSMRDITERKVSEEALRREQLFSEALIDSLPGIFYLYTYPELRLVRWNKNHETLLGFGPDEIRNRHLLEWHPLTLHDTVHHVVEQVMEKGMDVMESPLLSKTGEAIPFLMTGIRFESQGTLYLMGMGVDISERKKAESEREKLEAQLQQAQKMEAIGHLAGGVAHDFNNLLQVILGRLELIQDELGADTPNGQEIGEIRKAAERAAELTRQLLMFSRRQIIQPINLDFNALIESMLKMIRRLIGEHIDLRFIPGARLGTIYADKGQLEQVLMNLCVNARDAMPDGGGLIIETENVLIGEDYCHDHPWAMEGRYVLLSVTDTGCGMDEATCSQIFEPFFTTKEVGRGTGLGLATVYGIVKQHNGMIQVYSELKRGTAFKLYFPIVERPAEEIGSKIETMVVGGTETILVAEDEEMVREYVQRVLQMAGYTVLIACDGEEALRVFNAYTDVIDLALLDVMMPKLGGREVMDSIQEKNPYIRFLFSSGYSESAIHTDFVIKEGIRLISKPYRKPDLLRAVRETLDS